VLGTDAVWIWHYLRWQFFCRDPRWRAVMLAAVEWLSRTFEASDVIVTSDCFETICAFGRGTSFDEAVRLAIEHGQIEVEEPDQLCTIESRSSDVAMEPSSDLLHELRFWPRDKPLPEGWYRPEVIRYRGWWRPGWVGRGAAIER
jgi:hypothetical protein